jgi:hypothetical protein
LFYEGHEFSHFLINFIFKIECHEKIKEEEERKKLEAMRSRKTFRFGQVKGERSALLTDFLSREELEKLENVLPSYSLPKSLKQFNVAQLPPSLLPPRYRDFLNYEINEWS